MEIPATDLSFLKSFTEGDNTKMSKYIGNFLSMGPEKIAALRQNLEEKKWDEVRATAHKLKPQLSYMGINSIKEDIQKIEDFAESQTNLEEIPALVERVVAACNRAFSELNDFVKSITP